MTLRLLLRTAAVLMAIAGAIDPVLTLRRPVRPAIVIAVQTGMPGTGDVTGNGTAPGSAPLTAAAALRDLLADDYDARIRMVTASERTAACGTGLPCVLVGDDRWAAPITDGPGPIVGAIRVVAPEPWVRIADTALLAATHRSAVGRMRVDLEGRGVAGRRSVVDVLDDGVPVGQATHAWTGDGLVSVLVDWWPMESGLRRLSVRATGMAAGGVPDDQVDVGAPVDEGRYPVLVYDPRPSWTSTFLRRALEQDQRLAVRVVAKLGPQLQVTAGPPFRLDEAALAEASAVVIGAIDGLSARDVDLLERFVRVRGGSLILVPDEQPRGESERLLPLPFTGRLEPSPIAVGDWRASELLLFRDPRPGTAILAAAGTEPVVISTPTGNGRIVVSGALDAWRYRDADEGAFDRAWRSLVADAAAAAGGALDVRLLHSVARPGEDATVVVRLRAMTPMDAAVAMAATVACGDEPPRPLRLWPGGDRRQFQGRFTPDAAGTCRVAVASSAPVVATATADLTVAGDVHHPNGGILTEDAAPSVSAARMAEAFGARVVTAGDEAALAAGVPRLVPVERAEMPVRPMQSPWWIVPFAACLSAEWWLRRRHGLR